MQVLFLGRAPRTKETLPDFIKWRRVTRPPLVFRGLKGSQRTPGFWGVTVYEYLLYVTFVATKFILRHSKRDASKNVPTPTVSEYYEILLVNYISRDDSNGEIRFVIRDLEN